MSTGSHRLGLTLTGIFAVIGFVLAYNASNAGVPGTADDALFNAALAAIVCAAVGYGGVWLATCIIAGYRRP